MIGALDNVVRATARVRALGPAWRRSAASCRLSTIRCSPSASKLLLSDGIVGWVGIGSHTPLVLPGAGVDRFLRLSVHHNNTVEDIEVFARSLARAVG